MDHVNTLRTHDKLLAFSQLSDKGWMLGLEYKIIQTRVFKAALDHYYDEYVKVKNAASFETARYGGEEADEEDEREEKLQKIVDEFRDFYQQQKKVLDSMAQKD